MRLLFPVLAVLAMLAPVFAADKAAAKTANKPTATPIPGNPMIEFIGVEYKAVAEQLPTLYNYPDTPNTTNWNEMIVSLNKYKTQPETTTNTFRVPFNFKQLVDRNSTGLVNEKELNKLKRVVDKVVQSPGPSPYVVIVPEVVDRGEWFTDPDDVYEFWKTVAKKFQPNNHVIFDVGLPGPTDRQVAMEHRQGALNGIRRAGARKHYIFMPTDMAELTDPLRFAIEDPVNRTLFEVDINVSCWHPALKRKPKDWEKKLLLPFLKWMENTNKRTVVRRVQTSLDKGCPKQVEDLLAVMEKEPTNKWAGWLWKGNKQEPPQGLGL